MRYYRVYWHIIYVYIYIYIYTYNHMCIYYIIYIYMCFIYIYVFYIYIYMCFIYIYIYIYVACVRLIYGSYNQPLTNHAIQAITLNQPTGTSPRGLRKCHDLLDQLNLSRESLRLNASRLDAEAFEVTLW